MYVDSHNETQFVPLYEPLERYADWVVDNKETPYLLFYKGMPVAKQSTPYESGMVSGDVVSIVVHRSIFG